MKVLIIGRGVVGTIYGWALSKAGIDFTHVVRKEGFPATFFLSIADRLVTFYQLFMSRNPLLVGKALKNEILRAPLQNVGSSAAQIVEQGFLDIGRVADIYPFVRAVKAIDTGLFGCVAYHARPRKKKPLLLVRVHCEVLNCSLAWAPANQQSGKYPAVRVA